MTQIGVVIFIVSLISGIISSVVRFGIIKAVGKYAEKPKLGECLKTGFRLLIPVMVVGFVTSMVVFGSYFLLIVPGIVIGLFFHFVTYEMVLGEKKWFKAVTGSVQIMSQNFGDVLLRIIVLYVLVALLFQIPMFLLDTIVKALSGNAPAEASILMGTLSIIKFIVGTVLGFYGVVYGVITYLHAKRVTDEMVKPNMAWMWLVSILGWLIAVALGFQLIKFVSSPTVQNNVKAVTEEIKTQPIVQLTEQEKIAKWENSITPEAKVYFEKSSLIFGQMKDTTKKSAEIKKLNDENILALKKATEIDSGNPEIWASLSDAYTWINSKGTLNDALVAIKKAEELDSNIWSYPNRTAGILMMMGKYDEAILKYQQVIRMEDNYGRAHISLGVAYKKTGIKDLAKEELQKGIDILTKYNDKGQYDAEILEARKEMSRP